MRTSWANPTALAPYLRSRSSSLPNGKHENFFDDALFDSVEVLIRFAVFDQRLYGFAACLVAGLACMLLVSSKPSFKSAD